ncbi:MAG: DEAD/DEAH box helicase family protein [Lachnospiraceae bacterium]|jgi:superfamily II DNA or RNA helicase|nr:DEAD/DEAH box helicase family protein [Lachnospiraceae bacterium]
MHGNTINISNIRSEDVENLSIEDAYEMTDGRIEYGITNDLYKKMFYLTKANLQAKKLASSLAIITNNNPKYQEAINEIAENGFTVLPEIITRINGKGIRLSESVNLDLKEYETNLLTVVKELNEEQQLRFLQNYNSKDAKILLLNILEGIQSSEQIKKERYLAGATIDLYDWKSIGIEELTVSQRNDLLIKLQENPSSEFYQKIKSHEKVSISDVEEFLEYYDIEGTRLRLRNHQRQAVNNVDNLFEDKKFASAILATGAGKTFVAMTELLEHRDEKLLYLAPSEDIIEQVKDNIIEYIHGRKGTLGKTKDEVISEIFKDIKFETYPGLLAKRSKELINTEYGFIVFDELHRTGATEWEQKIDKLLEKQNENVKVLGITATPIRDSDDRDMSKEVALKLGYTEEEVMNNTHIALDFDFRDAIELGILMNPKVEEYEYMLEENGEMKKLLDDIDSITDEAERQEQLKLYETLRRNVANADKIEEIIKSGVKSGQKWLVFIPVNDNGEIEDEYGNTIGKKSGKEKVEYYRELLANSFADTDIKPKFYSMLGTYGRNKNADELENFKNNDNDVTKFMIVINKGGEGLHVPGLTGEYVFRPMGKSSLRLALQVLGRVMYAEDPKNPTPDNERTIIKDIAGILRTVDFDKNLKTHNKRDDLRLLSIVVDWAKENGIPDINSSIKQEQKMAATLIRIQKQYGKYLDGYEEYLDLKEDKINQIEKILIKGTEIDLWDIEFPPKTEDEIKKVLNLDSFELKGIMRDFIEIQKNVNTITSPEQQLLEWLEEHDGKMPRSQIIKDGNIIRRDELSTEEKIETRLYHRWATSNYKKILTNNIGKEIEDIQIEHQDIIARLRKYGLGINKDRNVVPKLLKFLEDNNGKLPRSTYRRDGKIVTVSKLSEKEKEEHELYVLWLQSEEFQILKEYAGQDIEKVPLKYREFVEIMRDYGFGTEAKEVKKTILEEMINFVETNNYKMPNSYGEFMYANSLKSDELSDKQIEEAKLYQKWYRTPIRKEVELLLDKEPEEIPQQYQQIVSVLKKVQIGNNKFEISTNILNFMEKNNGKLPRGAISKDGHMLKTEELTKEELYETRLRSRWDSSEIRDIIVDNVGVDIEYVPERYRNTIEKFRRFGIGLEKKTAVENYIEFVLKNNGKLPKSAFSVNGKILKSGELNDEQKKEVLIYNRYWESVERKVLVSYTGYPIEEVPDEYREVITTLRTLGLGLPEKTTAEKFLEFLDENENKLPKNMERKNMKIKLTEEQRKEKNLAKWFLKSGTKQAFFEYADRPIDDVPDKYKKIVEKLRSIDYGKNVATKCKNSQDIGKATFDVSAEECDKAEEAIHSLLEKQREENTKDE